MTSGAARQARLAMVPSIVIGDAMTAGRNGRGMNKCQTRLSCQGGFTYFGLLAMILIMGIVLASAGEVWHLSMKREKEQELLFVGNQFRQAIGSYYEHSPPQSQRYPARLEDLLKDPRYPSVQRYLRRIYADPINGKMEWGLVKGPDGGILGIHSLSGEEPAKKGNFNIVDKDFEGKKQYADWVFMFVPGRFTASPVQRP